MHCHGGGALPWSPILSDAHTPCPLRVRLVLGCVLLLALHALPLTGQSRPTATSTLAGTVLADSTERPIANAEVSVTSLRLGVRTDSTGAFVLTGIAPGRHPVVFRAVGYEALSTEMTFAAGERVDADVVLRPAVVLSVQTQTQTQTLARVDVVATSRSGNNPRIAEFDERRKMGFGRFLTQEVFEKSEGRKLSEILIGKLPGVRTLTRQGARMLVATRGSISMDRRPCPVQIIIDDQVRNPGLGQEMFDIDQVDPSTVAAVEFYTVSQRPLQFNRAGNAPCGTLVIWSRWGPGG